MPNIVSTSSCGGFLEDLLGFGQKAASTVLDFKKVQTQQKIDVLTTQANAQAQAQAAAARAAEEARSKSRRPLYIGLGVAAVVGVYLLSRRRR